MSKRTKLKTRVNLDGRVKVYDTFFPTFRILAKISSIVKHIKAAMLRYHYILT